MNWIIVGVFLFAISIIVFSFIDLKLSVAIYLAYLILVPYLEFKVAGFSLSYNLVNTVLFMVFLYQSFFSKRFNLDFKFIAPFLFLYISLLYISLFADGLLWSKQFSSWRVSFMQTCLVSFILWNLALTDEKTVLFIKRAFLIAITIAGIYGIYLMKMEGINPYINFLAEYFGRNDASLEYAKLESRLDFSTASKIQSTMNHPMTWGIVLCFSFITTIAFYIKSQNKILWFLFVLIGLNILISGVRTGLAALTFGYIYFLIRSKNIKGIILLFAAVVVIALFVRSNDSLSNIFASFTDVSGQKSDIKGSSISLRLQQLNGALNEIRGIELVGNGYGWAGYYVSTYGLHPVIMGFESLIFIVLCNSGFLGLLVWIIFFFLILMLNRKLLLFKTDVYLMDSFLIVYVTYAAVTGEYGYIAFFSFFYSFLLAYFIKDSQLKNYVKHLKVINNYKGFVEFDLINK
jgi:hypothetical protein